MIQRHALSVLSCLAFSVAAFAAQPWHQPFSPSSAEIIKAAAALKVPEKAEVLMLLEDRRYEIQSDGTTATTFRRLYRVLKKSAVDEWAEVEQGWEPWHENKPELRARVISPDASVHWLDPKTIGDAPAIQFDSTIFSDNRVIRAPLPAVEEGVVVEYEITQQETAPLFSAGVTRELAIGAGMPIERYHVLIEAAKGVSLKFGASMLPDSAITRTESKKGSRVELELGRQDPNENIEYDAPPEIALYPVFRFSTGSSWKEVAAAYERIVAEKLNGQDPKSLFKDLGVDPATVPNLRSAEAAQIVYRLHQRVRYTGVEFGQSAIVPNKPSEVLRRQYGDCKDKAALLVALLRAAGFDAHIALLNAGSRSDVDPQLPGLGRFDHAIVFVKADKPVWIDATAESTRVGTLPTQDQGRLALIVDSNTNALTMTPKSSSLENQITYNIEIHLRETGKGNIKVAVEAAGSFESSMRARYAGDRQQVHDALESLAKNNFGAKALAGFDVTKRFDFSQPFRASFEALESAAVLTAQDGAAAGISNQLVLANLPYSLLLAPEKDDAARKNDFLFREPYSAKAIFKVFPPPGSSARPLKPLANIKPGSLLYKADGKVNPDGTVELTYSVDTGKQRISAEEFNGLRKELTEVAKGGSDVVQFTFKTSDLVALGKSAEALSLLRKDAAGQPKNVLVQIRYAQALIDSGATDAALAAAKKAVEIDPKSAQAWHQLGVVYEHDGFGRLRAPGWNPGEAQKALRKAVELDDNDIQFPFELGILLEHNAAGERYAKDARTEDATSIYKKLLSKGPNQAIASNRMIALLHLGKYSEAEEDAKNVLDSQAPVLNAALTALTQGSDRAIIDNQAMFADPGGRLAHLAQTAFTLNQLRHYELAIALFKAAQRLSTSPELTQAVSIVSKMKRFEDALVPEDDPKRPVQELLVLVASRGPLEQQLPRLLSKDADLASWISRVERLRRSFAPFQRSFEANGASRGTMTDLLVSQADLSVRGSGNPAYLVDVNSHSLAPIPTVLVVKESGKCKLLAFTDSLEAVGKIALQRINAGELDKAQTWLDAVKDNALPRSPTDDKGPAFRYLWSGVAAETRNATFAKTAAASLLGTYGGTDESIRLLRDVADHLPRYMDRSDVYFALCEALQRAQKWKELMDAARLIAKSNSYREVAYQFSVESRIRLQQWAELQAEAEARMRLEPGPKPSNTVTVVVKPGFTPTMVKQEDGWALQSAAIALMRQGKFAQAKKYIERAKSAPYMRSPSPETLAAWNEILAGKIEEATLNDLQERSRFSASAPRETLYTLALALLTAEKVDEAKRIFLSALDQEDTAHEVSSLAWLVQGEIFKRYALEADAKSAFEKARKADDWLDLPFARFLLDREGGSTHVTAAQ